MTQTSLQIKEMIYKIIVTHVHGFEHCFEPSLQFETKIIVVIKVRLTIIVKVV